MKDRVWLRAIALLGGGLLGLFTADISAADQATDVLAQKFRDVYSSRQSRSFKGDFIYLREGQIETFRVNYSADANGVTEQIEVLSGRDQIPVQEKAYPAERLFTEDGGVFNRRVIFPARRGVNLQWQVIEESYQLKFYENGRVAGRKVLTVDIQPNQPDRYSYRVAIDQQTGVQLNREVYDCQQQMIEQMMFVDFTLMGEVAIEPGAEAGNRGVDLTEQLKNNSSSDQPTKIVENRLSAVQVDLAQLPKGFKLKRRDWGQGASSSVEHLLFSDELVLVSVYIEPVQPEWVPRHGQLQVGAISVFFQPLGDYEMLLLGELPMETLVKMAAGFTLRDSDHD